MKFPRRNDELNKMFKAASTPEISEFEGEYFVDMLTILPSLKKLSHRKTFYKEKGKVLGYNLLFTKKVWGHFFLEEGVCEEADSLKVVVINYGQEENSFISNRIRDQIRSIKTGNLYLGRFNYIIMGRLRFWGYFSLSR